LGKQAYDHSRGATLSGGGEVGQVVAGHVVPQAGQREHVAHVGVVCHIVGVPRALQDWTPVAVEECTFGGDGSPTGRGHFEEELRAGVEEM
jgi:hypothetical protein